MSRFAYIFPIRASNVFHALLSVGLVLASHSGRLESAEPSKIPTIADIVADVKHQWDQVESLVVEYELTVEAPAGAANAKRYLAIEFLAQEKVMFAFKGNKRYYRQLTPPSALPLAPNVEIDYDAIPGGEEMMKTREQTKAQIIAALGKEKAQAVLNSKDPKDPIRLTGHFEVAFDGIVLRRKNPGPLFAIHRIDDLDADDRWLKQDYLYKICHPLPDPNKPDNRHASSRLEEFLVSAHYVIQPALEDVEGSSCVVAAGPGVRLWLDPRIGYALRKKEGIDRGTKLLAERYIYRDFKQVLPGTWLPQMLQWERCGPPLAPPSVRGEPLLRYTYKVTRLSANNVPDSLFELEPIPGWIVWDGSVLPKKDGKDQYIKYTMPADPAQVDVAINNAIARAEARASWEQLGPWGRRWVNIALFFILSTVCILFWYFRRKHSLRTPGE
jgi:hypothetical protein